MTSVAPAPSEKKGTQRNNSKLPRKSSSDGAEHRDEILQSIASKQSALLQPVVTLTIYIPTQSVGAVIGRRGQNIANLQKTAALAASTNQPCRVSIVGQDSAESVPYTYSELDWSDSNWTPVVIRADPCAALTAAKKLEETVQTIDQVVLDLPISRNKHAAIVGKRGLTLASLSADTNVRIMVPNKDLRHDVIQLEGDLANVKECLASLLQIACKAKPPKQEDQASQTLVLPQLPSQTKLRKIGGKTECSIKKKKVDEEWQLTVSGGTQENVQSCVDILKKWHEDFDTAMKRSGRKPGGRNNNTNRGTPKRGKPANSKPSADSNSAET